MLLKRLTYPCRYGDMLPRFGRPVSVLCLATNCVLDHIYAAHHHRIDHWNAEILGPAALQVHDDTIYQKGAPLLNCFGFFDGTARPGSNQRIIESLSTDVFEPRDVSRTFTFLLLTRLHARPLSYKALILAFTT